MVLLALLISSIVVYLSNRQSLLIIQGDNDINNEIEDIQSVIITNQQRDDEESRKGDTKDEEEVKDVEVHHVINESSTLYRPLMKWRKEYSHPLTINSNRSF